MSKGLAEADVAAIKEALAESLGYLEKNDVEAWLSTWTEDGVNMIPGEPKYAGRDRLRELAKTIGGRKYVLSDVVIEGCEDLAVITTAISVPRAGAGGGADMGKQIIKMRKQPDGRWLFAAGVVNFDAPASF